MTKSDADQTPVLSYSPPVEPAPVRGVKWLILTVAGWLLVIVGGVFGLWSSGNIVFFSIVMFQGWRAGNTVVGYTQFYLLQSSVAVVGGLIFLAGLWLLRRRRQTNRKLSAG